MNERIRKGSKIYLVCDDSPDLFPNNQLRAFATEKDALTFIGEYVVYENRYTRTGYIKIVEMSIGKAEQRQVGMENI